MKTSFLIPALALATLVPASAATIAIVNSERGFLGNPRSTITTAHDGTTQVSFDATGASKLVVAIATESGFNNNVVTGITLSFNGVSMTQAVFGNTFTANPTAPPPSVGDAGGLAIFYLDSPFQGAANFTVATTFSGGTANGGLVSIFALSNTAPGVGNTSASYASQASAGTVSTSINTSADNSWVLGAVQNSGTNNSAGTPTASAPLTLGHNGFWGSQWGSMATGYQTVADSNTSLTPTFSTNAGSNIQIVSAEFLAIPEPAAALLGSLGMLLLLRRRR